MKHFDVAIVGAGVMGSATAHALARSGRKTVVFEQFGPHHERGSSHGRSRIFRYSYPESRYVEMAMVSAELWREVEASVGLEGQLLVQIGGLDSGDEIEKNAAALAGCGAAFELLEGREAQVRWPSFRFPDDFPVLFQPDGGIVRASAAIDAFQAFALSHGTQIHHESRVHEITPGSDSVTLHVGEEQVTARGVVVAAGAWVRKLLVPLGIDVPVRPTRETVAYFRVAGDPGPTLVEWGEPAIYAQRSPGHEGIKVGEHIAGPEADPDETGPVDASSVERLTRWVLERYAGAEPDPLHAETCFYTNTDDQRFILERHDRIVIGSPCSGHAFKFAPWIGRHLASLAEEAL
ncbi:MAG TPA: FAD-dependent oxidoreductase [Actinomycetota bacterium]|nr:FAD-dependent oxidoreductase [Actinomycetota bacterium]